MIPDFNTELRKLITNQRASRPPSFQPTATAVGERTANRGCVCHGSRPTLRLPSIAGVRDVLFLPRLRNSNRAHQVIARLVLSAGTIAGRVRVVCVGVVRLGNASQMKLIEGCYPIGLCRSPAQSRIRRRVDATVCPESANTAFATQGTRAVCSSSPII